MKKDWKAAVIAVVMLLAIAMACSLEDGGKPDSESDAGQDTSASLPKKLDSYELKGIKFAYYQIPTGLSRDELIEVARKIHSEEEDTQLILVDDDAKVAEYIAYVKAVSGPGDVDVELPAEWADEHIVANVQKHMNGRWVLYKSYGFEEIGELEPAAE